VARYRGLGEAETIVGRPGGEEFVILLPETNLAQVLVVAERIRASIADLEFPPLSKDSGLPRLFM
jgi:GGDEF domain-containing protein